MRRHVGGRVCEVGCMSVCAVQVHCLKALRAMDAGQSTDNPHKDYKPDDPAVQACSLPVTLPAASLTPNCCLQVGRTTRVTQGRGISAQEALLGPGYASDLMMLGMEYLIVSWTDAGPVDEGHFERMEGPLQGGRGGHPHHHHEGSVCRHAEHRLSSRSISLGPCKLPRICFVFERYAFSKGTCNKAGCRACNCFARGALSLEVVKRSKTSAPSCSSRMELVSARWCHYSFSGVLCERS